MGGRLCLLRRSSERQLSVQALEIATGLPIYLVAWSLSSYGRVDRADSLKYRLQTDFEG